MSGTPADRAAGLWLRLLGERPVSQLERIEQQLADLRRELAELRSGQANHAPPALAPIEDALRALEKQIGRAGREQLKANSIAEAQTGQIVALLEQVRAAEALRAAEAGAERERSRTALVAARLEVVQQLLPALDGIDAALRAGQQLLARAPAAPEPHRPESLFARLLLIQPHAAGRRAPAEAAELRAGLAAWLQGLTFIRQRLLDTLAAEQVRPIEAAGLAFDPQRHVALGVVPATADQPAGIVADELRRGYLVGERVLRPAEVIVASDEPV